MSKLNLSESNDDNYPQDPRLEKARDQNHLFDEENLVKDINYIPKSRDIEEGYAHQEYLNQQNKKSNQQSNYSQPGDYRLKTTNEYGVYSQTTVEEIPSQNPYFNPQINPKNQPVKSLSVFQKIGRFFINNKIVTILLLFSILSFGFGLTLFLTNKKPEITNQSIQAEISAPTVVANNGEGVWKLNLQNSQNYDFSQVQVSFKYDKTFTFSKTFGQYKPTNSQNNLYEIGTLAAKSSITIEFSGVLVGDVDEIVFIGGSVSFVPVNSSQKITQEISAGQTKIGSAEVGMNVLVPTTVQDGVIREIKVEMFNQSEKDLEQVYLNVIYPSSQFFEYQSSDFTLSTSSLTIRQPSKGNNIWEMEKMPRLRSQNLTIRGKFTGVEGTRISFNFQLISQKDGRILAEQKKEIQLVVRPISLEVLVNNKSGTAGVFDPSESIQFKVNYTNQSSQAINNVTLQVEVFDLAEVLDFSTIRYDSGEGNLSGNSVNYRGSGVSQFVSLPPQSSGFVTFSVNVKKEADFTSKNIIQDKFIITPKATITADGVDQIVLEGKGIKASGDVKLDQKVECKPDTTGSEKTCTVSWKFITRQTNISNLQVETTTNLPATAWNQSSVQTSQGEVSYNPNTGKIIWKAGRVKAYSGYFNQATTVTFQFKITSPEGGNTTLFSAPRITGDDEFTGEQYNFAGQAARP